jgi:hypothetical protein
MTNVDTIQRILLRLDAWSTSSSVTTLISSMTSSVAMSASSLPLPFNDRSLSLADERCHELLQQTRSYQRYIINISSPSLVPPVSAPSPLSGGQIGDSLVALFQTLVNLRTARMSRTNTNTGSVVASGGGVRLPASDDMDLRTE